MALERQADKFDEAGEAARAEAARGRELKSGLKSDYVATAAVETPEPNKRLERFVSADAGPETAYMRDSTGATGQSRLGHREGSRWRYACNPYRSLTMALSFNMRGTGFNSYLHACLAEGWRCPRRPRWRRPWLPRAARSTSMHW